MLSACSALRVPQKPSRAVALCGFLLHHIFAVAVNASHFLYRNRKIVIYLERYATFAKNWKGTRAKLLI
jgi:hypothetical protein